MSCATGPDGFNAALGQLGPLTIRQVLDSSTTAVEAVASDYLVSLETDAAGLITSVQATPYVAAPTSWSELDSRLRTLAPRASFTASVIDGDDCRPAHQIGGDTVHPLGSAVKLYIFGTPSDLCRALAGLWRQHTRPGQAPIDTALSIEDGRVGLDQAGGRVVMTSVMLADPDGGIDPALTFEVLAPARGGLRLAAEWRTRGKQVVTGRTLRDAVLNRRWRRSGMTRHPGGLDRWVAHTGRGGGHAGQKLGSHWGQLYRGAERRGGGR